MKMFAILDKKTGANGILPAFDMNACRRNLKKQNGWSRIPKKLSVREMSQAEVEAMIQMWQNSQAQTVSLEDGTPLPQADVTVDGDLTLEGDLTVNDVPALDRLDNFQEIDATQARLDAIEGELAEATPAPEA